ncbi:MAG: PEPxxWA-CTERM sorting domain-containing protein [Alphaproteobacteria bacterium]|nr:PEPxxWA-CTERM sorting domain-containing protein [Alphaproteobacteria bacterium]MBU1513117.1 PEPxxWA-CTERM sorting domain-containing protein [Alphaproteobacteria bacterium]MBU2095225.1 PEPxxWA-CTERM sorting domain-containing protein [Alphaproteobacteria bacterium]MBU2150616.1 PEPxxWA-CTERM sorting domain-containing protein [Alphaproteobacteria bacterium]MBU2306125.1 PEPxxWA-CTERM sorting domain-containing protein [Alphaproteobacteria bacterium]
MPKFPFAAPAAALAMLLGAGAAQASISYTFDTGNQGWSYGGISSSTPDITGASPWDAGGFLRLADLAAETGVYAPGAVLGDQSAAYGGNISFDIGDAFNDASPYVALILYGSGLAVSIPHAQPGITGPVNFSFDLTEAGFTVFNGNTNPGSTPVTEAEFRSVLANLTGIAIRTEWNTGPDDSTVDNVVFTGFGGDTAPVPEPAAWALMIMGFGLAGASLRRRALAA